MLILTYVASAALGWWVWSTPSKPATVAEYPPWARAAAARAMLAVFGASMVATLAQNVAPTPGVWPWVGAIIAAAATIGLTVTAMLIDPKTHIPKLVVPLVWVVVAAVIGVWAMANTTPTSPGAAYDPQTSMDAGARAAAVVLAAGAVHTWWVWRQYRQSRRARAAQREAQVRAMRRRIESERHPRGAKRGRP